MAEFFLWAHRGASAVAPENTMAAFRAAEEAGADGIELDVHLSSDGVPVVLHDATLERTSNGRGPVGSRSWAELSVLDAGSWFGPAFAGEGLPRLDEVLAWAGDRLALNLEIKESVAAAAVLALAQRFPLARLLVSSFDHALLIKLRGSAPQLLLGFLTERGGWRPALAAAAGHAPACLHPRQERVTADLVRAAHAVGVRVYPWVVDDPQRLGVLRHMGVDGVFTNHPGLLRPCLHGAGNR